MSKIKLYRNCKILEEKNLQVDNIEEYLATLVPAKVFDNAQYIKQGLDTEVKVTLDQTYLDKEWTNMYNYCSIENVGGQDNTYYYFIREMLWTSKNAIKLVLRLDVLNTFNGAYQLTDKTTIVRQHKNRLKKGGQTYTQTFTSSSWALDVNPQTHETFGSYASILLDDYFIDLNLTREAFKVRYNGQLYSCYRIEYTGDNYVRVYTDAVISILDSADIIITYNKLTRLIDLYPENINCTKYKTYENVITDASDMRWYLVYTSDVALDPNTTQPISTLMYPQQEIEVRYTSTAAYNSIDSVNEVVGSYGYFVCKDHNTASKVYGSNDGTNWTEIMTITSKMTWNTQTYNTLFMSKSGSKIACYSIYFYQKGGFGPGELKTNKTSIGEYTYIRLGDSSTVYYKRVSSAVSVTDEWLKTNYLSTQNNGTPSSWAGTTPQVVTGTCKSIDTLDRTDEGLVKVIELPYCPASIVKNAEGKYTLDNLDKSVWEFDSNDGCFRLLNATLQTSLGQELATESHPLRQLFVNSVAQPFAARNDVYESKLFHSEFYTPKYVYDTFSHTINLENYDINTPVNGWKINYVVSNTCNSRFLFDFKSMVNKYSTMDYENIMLVNRNNDLTIANSNYLNYLRTGYNYDMKNKEMNQKKEWLSIASGAARGAISGAMSSGGNPYAAAAGLVIGTATSAANAYMSDIQAQMAIEHKLEELSHQSATVVGSDDIDLLRYYTDGNKMKYCIYEVSDKMRHKLLDLFHYCGYTCDYQDIPDVTSRYWFNYIQCSPVFDENSSTAKMGKECKDELIAKYNAGVTVLHDHQGPASEAHYWDFEQKYENFENSLF